MPHPGLEPLLAPRGDFYGSVGLFSFDNMYVQATVRAEKSPPLGAESFKIAPGSAVDRRLLLIASLLLALFQQTSTRADGWLMCFVLVCLGLLQLPRCWGFVHFPPTPEGEQAAKDAIQALTGTAIAGMKVKKRKSVNVCCLSILQFSTALDSFFFTVLVHHAYFFSLLHVSVSVL